MRIYFNTSALNRPLDDLSSERVRLEAEAMLGLLAAAEEQSTWTSRSAKIPTKSGSGE